MITPSVRKEIEQAIKDQIVSIAPLSAANTAQIYRLKLAAGRTIVAKIAERGLDTEAFMLNYLREKSSLPLPEIYYANAHVILMEFIETHFSMDLQAQIHAADLLAGLHQVRGQFYGFERDTSIASLTLPNMLTKDWPGFFAEQRLLYMATAAHREGKIEAKMLRQFEKLAGKISAYLKDCNPPSLVHGDVWGGNVLAGRGRVAAFLDPAIYYADAEVELSVISLFETFGESFFRRYNEFSPIRFGFFEERQHIYNLYPLMVHTRLYGSSYARKAQKILDRFA